jgi:ABC-type ATPase involved in cell division
MTYITEAEELFMHYKNGVAGSGMAALIEAIFKLDRPNRAKIALGFPDLVEVCNRFNNELGYWEDLQKRWKQEYNLVNADL